MAKYRHRVFEMYECRDEALLALTPKARPISEAAAPKAWTLKHLTVTHAAQVALVEFKGLQSFGDDSLSDLRDDFSQLAGRLAIDSKVLLDFSGVEAFCAASIDALVVFNRQLRTKGSRMALCCLDPAVRASFFAARLA